MASLVPADTLLLAGLNLPEIRASPLYPQLPLVAPVVESLPDATRLLLAFNGKDLLMIARGRILVAPAGWRQVEPSLAVSGSDNAVHAAVAQHQRGSGSPARLLSDAASIAAGKPIWIVAPGGVALPLSGNAANLNRLLRNSEFAAVTAALGPPIRIEFTAIGHTPDAARDVEETLRAVLALMAMAEKRGSDVAALLGAVEIRREDRTVHASVSTTADAVAKLLASR
jgi:hypothetical protein